MEILETLEDMQSLQSALESVEQLSVPEWCAKQTGNLLQLVLLWTSLHVLTSCQKKKWKAGFLNWKSSSTEEKFSNISLQLTVFNY